MPSLTINAKPKAKERPRVGRNGHIYTPRTTSDYEALISDHWQTMFPDVGPYDEPVSLAMYFTPSSVEIDVHPIHMQSKLRGDVDNYAKAVMDALNGIAYTDDKLVHAVYAEKT